MTHIQNSVKEALQSILPIAAIVLILSISIAPLHAGVLVLFLFGTILLIIGMSFFYDWFGDFNGAIRGRNRNSARKNKTKRNFFDTMLV